MGLEVEVLHPPAGGVRSRWASHAALPAGVVAAVDGPVQLCFSAVPSGPAFFCVAVVAWIVSTSSIKSSGRG
jgi:hypothetical protein